MGLIPSVTPAGVRWCRDSPPPVRCRRPATRSGRLYHKGDRFIRLLFNISLIPNAILFLTLKLPILSNDILPRPPLINNILNNLKNLLMGRTNLSCTIPLTERNRIILDSLEVNCDSEGSSKFIVAGIATPDGLR